MQTERLNISMFDMGVIADFFLYKIYKLKYFVWGTQFLLKVFDKNMKSNYEVLILFQLCRVLRSQFPAQKEMKASTHITHYKIDLTEIR